jgi:D-glycero-alpha-D-manno-heptose 1-phosphate guanylyltransferase
MPQALRAEGKATNPVTITGTKAVLLVGGLGTRLRTVVPAAPKALAQIGDRPFLELLIRQLSSQGIRNLILCTGFLADQIEAQFEDGSDLGVAIEYSKEPLPLGTAGALKLAEKFLQGVPDFLMMNGDSFLELDLRKFMQFHRTHAGLATMAVIPVENAGRYGTVDIDSANRVIKFVEKTGDAAPGLVNAGVYIFSRAILELIPAGSVSLEKEVFPSLLERGVYAAREQGMFIDIGTPADYVKAQQLSDRLRRATSQASGS